MFFLWQAAGRRLMKKKLEEPDMAYDDGALNLFLYTSGKVGTVPQPLKDLLHCLENTTWQNAVNDSLKEIQTMVDKVKHEETAIIVYMKGLLHDQLIEDKGRREGLKESLLSFLSDLGPIPKDILEQIDNEPNPTVLTRWLKLAARSDSIEEFTKQMT